MGNPPFDPKDLASIASTLASYTEPRVGLAAFRAEPTPLGNGLDTYIYAFELADAPPPWDGPLVLRVYPNVGQADKARREEAVQIFATARGFPAATPIAVETQDSPFGLPFMVMRRVPGSPAMDRLKNPLAIPGLIRTLAGLQARLHQLPTDGCPLPSSDPLVDRLLADVRGDIAKHSIEDVDEMMSWTEANATRVRTETPALLHNDFHPLNVMLDGADAYVLDWSDAAMGDRHCDLARTLALFWLAPPFARSTAERTLLTLARGYLVRTYRRAYEHALPVDEGRLRYWQALHALRTLVMVKGLRTAGEAGIGAREGASDSVPVGFEDKLIEYFEDRIR